MNIKGVCKTIKKQKNKGESDTNSQRSISQMREPEQAHIGRLCPRLVTPSPVLYGWMWAVTLEAGVLLPFHLGSRQKEADPLSASAYIL